MDEDIGALLAEARAARQGRGFLHALGDNIIGYDDGVQSFGESLATALNIGGESMTMGLVGEEASAAVEAAIGPGTFDDRLAARRLQEATFRRDHPVAAATAEIGGALALPAGLGAGLAARGANLVTRGFIGGTAGAAAGAVAGYMEGGENGTDRLTNSVFPSIVGGAVGAVAPGLGALAQTAYRRFGPGAAAALRRAERQTGLRGAGTEMVAEAVERDAPFAGVAMANAGPEAINAQMGPNTMGLLDFAMNRPGGGSPIARAAVEALGERRGEAFTRALDQTLGQPQGVARTQKDIMQSTEAARRAAYAVPYGTPIDYSSEAGQQLISLLRRVPPSIREQAMGLGRAAGAIGQEVATDVDDLGRPVVDRMPDVAQIDWMLRALQDVSKPTVGVGSNAASVYRGLHREIRDTLDQLVPSFRFARETGQDAIANRNAVEFGESLLSSNMKMDAVEDALSAMGPAEKQYAAQGLRSYIEEVMANARVAISDPTANRDIKETMRAVTEITTRASEVKLRALLGPEAAEQLIQSAKEMRSVLTLRANTSMRSPTQPRQVWEARLQDAVPVSPMEALQETGTVGGAVAAGLRPLAGDPAAGRLARQDEIMEAVARALVAPARDGNALARYVPQLPALVHAARQGSERVGGVVNELGALASLLASQHYAQTGPR